MEFVLSAEKEFDLQLPNDELSLINTVGELTDLIHQKLLNKHGFKPCPSNDYVYEKIKDLLVERQGLVKNSIIRTSRLVLDLYMD